MIYKKLFGSFGFRLDEIVSGVFLLKLLDAAGRIHKLLLARIKRMAHRAYLHVNLRNRRAGLERMTATAFHMRLHVLGMDIFLHNNRLLMILIIDHCALKLNSAFYIEQCIIALYFRK